MKINAGSASEGAEPVRLLQGGGSAHERRLLESAALDEMPSSTPERLARALAQPGALGPVPRRWTRLKAVGGLGGLGGLGVVALFAFGAPGNGAPAAPTSLPGVSTAPAPAAAPEAAAPEGTRLDARQGPDIPNHDALSHSAEPSVVAEPVLAAPLPARASSEQRARPARQEQAAAPGAGLVDEVRFLERARAALRAGRTAAAEWALADYRARFAHGEMAFEAELLEAERASADGDAARAAAIAGALLGQPGAARYEARLARLLQASRTNAAGEGSDQRGANMDGRRSNP